MSDSNPSDEFVELAARFADEELSGADLEAFLRLRDADPANAEWFVEWMELNAMLQLDLGHRSPVSLTPNPLLPADVDKRRRFLRSKGWLALASSLALCATFLVGAMAGRLSDVRQSESRETNRAAVKLAEGADGIATIAGGVDAEFADGLTLGSRLTAGLLRVERGVARIVFDRGAVVVLQGPAELELLDAGACRLVSGSLSADVSPDANGFSVGAGDIQIHEHNARFGLKTGPQTATEVHAFGGGLELIGFESSNGRRRRLAEGEALRWRAGSAATGIAIDPDSFISSQELARRQELSEQLAYERWLEYSERWLHDPAVEVRYEFSPSSSGAIVNTVDPSIHPARSRQLSPRWIAGRWGNKMAMLFDGRTDVLEVADHADLRMNGDFTLAVWLRPRSYSKKGWTRIVGKGNGADRNYGLWIDSRGSLLWQVCPDADPESQETWNRYSLYTAAIPIDEWQCVVGVVEGGKFKIYINGELQKEAARPAEIAVSEAPLTIGHYADFPNHDDFFCGELDELILLKRALSESEIRELFEAGQPNFVKRPGNDRPDSAEQVVSPPSV